jgi:hypothetical protein
MKSFRRAVPAIVRVVNYGLRNAAVWGVLGLLSVCPAVLAQQASPAAPMQRLELPVILRQKVVAGVTPVGSMVEAKLQIATLISGTVVPQGAILSGHLEQSAKKSGDAPSRVKIKFDSAKWKKGTAPLEVYFTGCFYPVLTSADRDRSANDAGYGSISRPAEAGDGQYPPPPGPKPGQIPQGFGPDVPMPIATRVSSHWVRPLGADAVFETDGSIALESPLHDIKLDKETTYMLTNALPVSAAPAVKH